MNAEKMKEAEKAAKTFLISIIKMETRVEEECRAGTNSECLWFNGCKESGAMRRASLNLTRALSNLRK